MIRVSGSRLKGPSNNAQRAIRREEIGVAIGYGIFGVAWIFIVIPYLVASSILLNLNTVVAYLIYNVGYVFAFAGIFGLILGVTTGKTGFLHFIASGIAGFVIFSWVFDMWAPPLYLNPMGLPEITVTAGNLENTAVDYMFATVYSGAPLNISGPLLFYMVYAFTPLLGIIIAFLLLSPQVFLREAGF